MSNNPTPNPKPRHSPPARPPTSWRHPLIIWECGTSKNADIKRIIEDIKAKATTQYIIVFGDMQTFKGMWHAKFKYPELCRNMIFLPADLHGEIHQEDGVWRLAYAHIINPIEVRLGLSGLSLNLNMKNHNTRNLWLIIIMSAGLVWLDGLGIPEQTLRDVPGRLLPLTQHNLPVHDFIGFLFYHCLPVHEWKRSLRVSNSTHLDWLWRYSIILYGDTKKYQYKIGCLRATKVFFDSEPNVQSILSQMRTFSRTGSPCCGEGWDDPNEVSPASPPPAPAH